MKRLVIAATIVTLIAHNVAGVNPDDREPVQSVEPAFVNTERANDGYKISLEELLKSNGDIVWLLDVAKGDDAARVQTVALNVLTAQEAGKEYLEDTATIALLNMLLEKYRVDKFQVSGTERIRIQKTVRHTTPAIRGFGALGTHHSNHSKQQGSQELQTTPTSPGKVYKVSDFSKIDDIRVQIAKDYGEKIAETMEGTSTYKTGVKEAIRKGKTTITLHDDKIIGGYLTFIIAVRYGIVQYDPKSD